MKRLLPILLLLFYCFQLSAQKACFIKGSFIAAFYSKHDQKIKFVNTFTNQVFYWYEYKGSEPVMWFANNLLLAVDKKNVIVSNFQTGKKNQYTITGKLIPNTLLQLIESDEAISISHIVTQKQMTYFQKPAGLQYVSASMSGNEKKISIHWKKDDRQFLCFYEVVDTLQLKWQLDISGNSNTSFILNLNGHHLAKWNGKETELIETGSQKTLQIIGNNNRCLRFNTKDELICVDEQNQSTSLYSKNKDSVYKSAGSMWYKDRIVISPDKQESFIEWDESCVSDDLAMTIGFGSKCVALLKNGLVFLFFDQR